MNCYDKLNYYLKDKFILTIGMLQDICYILKLSFILEEKENNLCILKVIGSKRRYKKLVEICEKYKPCFSRIEYHYKKGRR